VSDGVVWSFGQVAESQRLFSVDPLLTNVEPAAPFAAVNGQLRTFADATGRFVPELERDTMPVRRTSVGLESLAALSVRARQNQWISRHHDRPSRARVADLWAVTRRAVSLLSGSLE
jgi:hypothetical protein